MQLPLPGLDDQAPAAPRAILGPPGRLELTPAQWRLVKARGARLAVLRAAASGGRAAVLELLDQLAGEGG